MNLRQRRWLELLKDYDCTILYHPGKANIVADALSKKSMGSLVHIAPVRRPLVEDIHKIELEGVHFDLEEPRVFLAHVKAQSSFKIQIQEAQKEDPKITKIVAKVKSGKGVGFIIDNEGVLRFGDRLCIPNIRDLKKTILEEAHNSKYSVHPGATKMYQDLKQLYWWEGMKRDITEFVSHCLICQQVKAEHQRLAGLLQQIEISEWKWERITMDCVTGLPHTLKGYDAIWVIVDRMTKSAHFLPVKTTFSVAQYTQLYIDEILRLHGIPISIIFHLDLSIAFHPQTDGQSE